MNRFIAYMSIPGAILLFSFSSLAYLLWKEHKINNYIIECALQGNPAAIELLIKHKKPWKLDEKLVYKAIEGNEHAIKILTTTTNCD